MKRIVLFVLAGAFGPVVLAAQAPDMQAMLAANPVSTTARIMLMQDAKNITAAAELMPADKYTFHPTPAQMTFGQLIVHIVQTNELLCSSIGGTSRTSKDPSETDPKGTLTKAVKDSFDHCSAALANLTDSQVGDSVGMGPQKAPRVYLMMVLIADWADHYSTQASYLRLNGILPPTAKPPAK